MDCNGRLQHASNRNHGDSSLTMVEFCLTNNAVGKATEKLTTCGLTIQAAAHTTKRWTTKSAITEFSQHPYLAIGSSPFCGVSSAKTTIGRVHLATPCQNGKLTLTASGKNGTKQTCHITLILTQEFSTNKEWMTLGSCSPARYITARRPPRPNPHTTAHKQKHSHTGNNMPQLRHRNN